MRQKFHSVLQFLGNRQVRLAKAAAFCALSLFTLVFLLESSWMNQHLRLAPEQTSLPGIESLIFLLGPFLGLDPMEDHLKLFLLVVLCCALILTWSLILVSWWAFLFGFSFVGNQLWQIWTNYHLEREVLYRWPFTREAWLFRQWTPEEKMEFLQKKLQMLCDSKQLSLDDLDLSLETFQENLASFQTKESLETALRQCFEQSYAQYLAQASESSFTDTGTSFWSSIPEFLTDHLVLTAVVVCSIIFVVSIIIARRTPPGPPDFPGGGSGNLDPQKEFTRIKEAFTHTDEAIMRNRDVMDHHESALVEKIFPTLQDYDQWFNYIKQDVRQLFRLMEAIAAAHPEWFEGLEVKQDPRSENPPKL